MVLRFAFPVIVLAFLWRITDGPEILRMLRRADWGWLAVAFGLSSLQIVLSAIRWKIATGALGFRLGTGRAVSEYYLSQLLNLTLPSGIVGDATRALRLRHDTGTVVAAQSVLIERLAGQMALLGTMFLGFALLPWLPGHGVMPGWVRDMVLMIGIALAAIVAIFALAHGVPGPIRRAAESFSHASARALCSPRVWPWQLVLSLGTVACTIGAFTAAARATGTVLSFPESVTIVPLVFVAMIPPVSPGGWGLREMAAAALWPLVGGTGAAGIAAAIAFGLAQLAASLPGLAVLVARPSVARDVEDCEIVEDELSGAAR